mmetsp:Transcript_13993/g.20487  ORF Transcript_13993/g.20487 Transcript_13993/m.20487 type:complete len:84 (+) Transcript_13993:184-435(+)
MLSCNSPISLIDPIERSAQIPFVLTITLLPVVNTFRCDENRKKMAKNRCAYTYEGMVDPRIIGGTTHKTPQHKSRTAGIASSR